MYFKFVLLIFLLINSVLAASNVEEIKKLIAKCKGSSEGTDLQNALDELNDVLDYAPFFYAPHKKCKGLADMEDSTDRKYLEINNIEQYFADIIYWLIMSRVIRRPRMRGTIL